MSDEGVSELLGYAILAGVVITAVICIASGAGGAITAATEGASFSEASLAIRSLAATASNVAHANNTYFTAAEIQVPPGYELLLLDGPDDIASISVSDGDGELFAVREGSIRLQSPFRSVSFEGGGVYSNASGLADIVRKPSIFIAGHGRARSLYIFLTTIETDTRVVRGGSPVVLGVRATPGQSISLPAGGPVTIAISSTCPEGWSGTLRDAGFSVSQEGDQVTATMGGIADVCIDCRALQVRVE